MKNAALTTVGRSIDLSYPTNRAIAVVSFLVMVGAVLLQRTAGAPWLQSLLWGAQAALSIFLAWVLCRELDPDHDLSAFVAAGVALGGLLLWGLPRLAVIFWLILVVRVVNRSMGPPAGVLDSLGILGLGIWLSLQGHWGYALVTALVFFLDGRLPTRAPRQLLFALSGALGTAIVAVVGADPPWDGAPSPLGVLIAAGICVLFLPVIAAAGTVSSMGDQTGEPLKPVRVRAAQLIALLVGVHAAFLGGLPAQGALMPLWAAALGASLHRLYRALNP
ncbi:MAG: hypothetical protein ACOC7Y_02610 [Chloroflexota bacterium]